MKDKILKLREKGLSHREIAALLKCSRSTVAYHCNNTTKEKSKQYRKNHKDKGNVSISIKLEKFQRKDKLYNATRGFSKNTKNFTTKDVINKFGLITKCYLTGQTIDLMNDKYEFDHIIPRSKGGSNTIDNLGITIPEANRAKYNFTIDEFLNICEKVLLNKGYSILKP